MGADETQVFDTNFTNWRESKYTPENSKREPREPREHEFKCADGAKEISPGLPARSQGYPGKPSHQINSFAQRLGEGGRRPDEGRDDAWNPPLYERGPRNFVIYVK